MDNYNETFEHLNGKIFVKRPINVNGHDADEHAYFEEGREHLGGINIFDLTPENCDIKIEENCDIDRRPRAFITVK
jgi:hypothetical protein